MVLYRNPNGVGLTEWLVHTESQPTYMDLRSADNMKLHHGRIEDKRCDLWFKIFDNLHKSEAKPEQQWDIDSTSSNSCDKQKQPGP